MPRWCWRDAARSVATDGAGHCYVTRSYQEVAQFGSTQLKGGTLAELFLTKHDGDGKVLWARNSGGGEHAVGNGVAADDQGNVWCVGDYYPGSPLDRSNSDGSIARFDPAGAIVWYRVVGGSQPDSAQAAALDKAGNCYVTGLFTGTAKFGSVTLASRGARDIFVLKYDPSGKVIWAQRGAGKMMT